MNGDSDYKKAVTLYGLVKEKWALRTEAAKAGTKRGKKMELHRKVETRDQRPERGKMRKKLPGFAELFSPYSNPSCYRNTFLFLIF